MTTETQRTSDYSTTQAARRATDNRPLGEDRPGIVSTVAIGKHPVHPILVTFPITTLVGTLITDLVYWRTNNEFWAQASYWLLWAGIVTAVLAALTGLLDFLRIHRVREHRAGWLHMSFNAVALILSIVNLYQRRDNVAESVWPWGIGLSAVVTVLLIISGWYGGELIYRYKVAVFGDEHKAAEQPGLEALHA